MKVIHTIGGFGVRSGGTSTCTYDLLTAMTRVAPDVGLKLLTPMVNNPDDRLMGHGEKWIEAMPYDYRTPLCLSVNFRHALRVYDVDVLHTNGLWMHCNHATCAEARRRGIPYVITPHGMLYPEALRRSRWKKLPMEWLWFRRDILRASAIHVTCEREMEHVRAYGYRGPVAVIPNPVEMPPYVDDIVAAQQKQSVDNNGPCKLGFLGRLHPRKQVERLLYGAALLQDAPVAIHIFGSGSEDYERFLRAEVARLGLTDRVRFHGFISGRAKFEALATLDALFVPSDMENFGMIVPEALLVHTPVMASLGTPWESLNKERCGWWTDTTPESVAAVIAEIMRLTPDELRAMGARGAAMTRERFAADTVAASLLSLYHYILDFAPKPSFVYV